MRIWVGLFSNNIGKATMGYKAHSGFSFLEINMKLFLISLIPKIVKPKMKKKDIKIPEITDFSPEAFKKNRKRDGYLLKQMPVK